MNNTIKQLKKKTAYGVISIAIIFTVMLAQTIMFLYPLVSKSYIITTGDIYAIDTFRTKGHLYDEPGYKGTRKKFVFHSDSMRHSFTIEGSLYEAVTDQDALEALKYKNVLFRAYSTKNTLERYHKAEKAIDINVLQIEIDGKKLIDLDRANNKERSYLSRRIMLNSVFLLLLVVVFFKALRRYKEARAA